MEQEHRLEELRQYARTTVLEQTETQKDSQTESLSKLNLLTKQMSKIEPTVAPVQEQEKQPEKVTVTETAKETKSLSQIIMEQHLAKQDEEIKKEQEIEQVEEVEEEQVEEQVESLYAESLSLEASDEVQLEDKTESGAKSYKFRFRLLTVVFCLILAIMGGWIIGEAVEIGKTSTEIITETTKGTEYNANITKLITNISKIDKDDSEPATPSEGSLFPIEELIPITPQAPLDSTGYEEESNWFDKICNWIINIFGG